MKRNIIEITLTKEECIKKFKKALIYNQEKKTKLVWDEAAEKFRVIPEKNLIIIVPFEGDIYRVTIKDPKTNPNTPEFIKLKKEVGLL